jgi:hypothetical protein
VNVARSVCSMVMDVEVFNNHYGMVEFLKDMRGACMMGMGGDSSIAIVDIDDHESWFG